jgi:hypothetical protein
MTFDVAWRKSPVRTFSSTKRWRNNAFFKGVRDALRGRLACAQTRMRRSANDNDALVRPVNAVNQTQWP